MSIIKPFQVGVAIRKSNGCSVARPTVGKLPYNNYRARVMIAL